MYSGKKLGDIATRIAEDVRLRRRLDAGIDEDPIQKKVLPTYMDPEERRKRELEGGIVLIGRPTFKEFMAGLKKGWSSGLQKVDGEEILAQELEDDHYFDEVDDDMLAPASKLSYSPIFTMSSQALQQKRATPEDTTPDVAPPQSIPQLPPLLLVPFSNRIGFTQIPIMIWEWFNKRRLVQSGAEAAYSLVLANSRPISVPSGVPSTSEPSEQLLSDSTSSAEHPTEASPPSDLGDLDFDLDKERLFKKSLYKIPEEVEQARKEYYEKLPARLATARALARGTREWTKDEVENPPPTEVELRAERMKREQEWRFNVASWNRVKGDTPVEWDERFRDALRVFSKPPSDASPAPSSEQ
jgi:import inner membrane translocase subunit TIM54